MLGHDPMRDTKPESCPAIVQSGRAEWIEDAPLFALLDAPAIVGDVYASQLARAIGSNADPAIPL